MRKQFNDIVFGGNGSGKTTFEIKAAVKYLKNDPRKRVLFIIPDDSEEKLDVVPEITLDDLKSFKGIAKLVAENDKIFALLLDFFSDRNNKFNGLVIPDDCGVFLKRRPENVLKLFKRRRQLNIDFLWSFHGFNTEIPRAFFAYVNRLYIFETSDSTKWTRELLPIDKQAEFDFKYNEVQSMAKQGKKYQFRELIIRNTN